VEHGGGRGRRGLGVALLLGLGALLVVYGPGIIRSAQANRGDRRAEQYPAVVRSNFLGACEAQVGATREGCACLLNEFEQQMGVEDFARLERELLRGDPEGEAADRTIEAWVACL